ncbi:hypothetical protein JW964_22765 [candidate division KSB1 bacterium]|nr:hypothetical protein [candidate division KSB1 bacterium]
MEIKNTWSDIYKIHSYQIDFRANLTIPALCQFMQESAWKHAESFKAGFSHLGQKNLAWVLLRQRIKIEKFPKWGDTIQVTTWPAGKDRLFYYRDFKITNAQNETLGIATTVWLIIDILQRRPQRMNFEFEKEFEQSVSIFPKRLEKLESFESGAFSNLFQVGYRDLDINEHVNNVRYLEWILENFSVDFYKNHYLNDLEINYINEALYNDKIKCFLTQNGNNQFLHTIQREADGKEICRAKTLWQNI